MRIIVPLRRVLDPAGIVAHRRLRRLFINREEYILQPADHCALEAALRIKDRASAEVVVVSGQPEPGGDTLRRGLAMGADRAIYLSGADYENADEAVAVRALAAVIERLGGGDLVLAGATRLDTGQGQLALRLAEGLGWPQIGGAWWVEVSDGRLQAVQRDGDGFVRVEAGLPVVVTVAAGAMKPRYPDGARLINVYRGEGAFAAALDEWDAGDLLPADARVPVLEDRGRDFPPERERGALVEGTGEEAAQIVAEALRQRLRR
ncbi:MAG: electron transfer flavoprotein subunit beta/FixA family protein [Chloroflexota bacterium]